MPIIKLENITKTYKYEGGTVTALNNISLEIKKGEMLVIMGPSGSGKSTLLNILAGIDRPTSGSFSYNGTDMQKASSSLLALYRQKIIGIVFQSFNLINNLSTKDNVKMPRLLSDKKKMADSDTLDILEKLEIKDKANTTPSRLSGGQQQRVTIARALINNPEILLADEPTGNLDSKTSDTIMEIFRKINKEQKKTVVIITHNPELTKYADRVITMRDGKIENIEVKNENQNESDPIKLEGNPGKLGFGTTFMVASANLKRTKLRTFLTSFGVAVGIAAMILLVSFASAIENTVIGSLSSLMSLRQISVTSQTTGSRSLFKAPTSTVIGQEKVLDKTALASLSKIPHVQDVYPLERYVGTISYNGKQASFIGANSAPVKYIDPSTESVTSGRIFNSDNEKSIILTDSIAKSFGIKNASDMVGKTVNIDISILNLSSNASQEKPFTGDLKVIGISSQTGATSYPILPFNLYSQNPDTAVYSTFIVNVDDQSNVASVKKEIDNMGYSATSLQDIISQIDQVFIVLKAFLGLVGGIALIVACLGIINVMLISVLERIKEIGIMKAVGARPSDIRRLFVSEAILIGLIGGILGVVTGIVSGVIINKIANIFISRSGGTTTSLFAPNMLIILLSIVLAVIISVLAALYPSAKAASLSPIEALRRE